MAGRRRQHGFSLMECLLLVAIIGIVGGAAGQALMAHAKAPRDTELQFQFDTAVVSKMEALRGLPFSSLAVGNPSSQSDWVAIGGKYYPRTVTISNVDLNGDGVAEASAVQITVQVSSASLTTLVTQP